MSDPSNASAHVHLRRIAKIVGAQGLKGQIRIKPYNAQPDWLDKLTRVFIFNPEQPAVRDPQEVEELLMAGDLLLAKLKGIDDRTQAEKLTGRYFALPEDELPALTNGEYYLDQLRGVSVFSTQGNRRLGFVKQILDSSSGDFIEISPEGGGETVVVPFQKHFIQSVDAQNKRLYLHGLDELFPAPKE